MKRKILKTVILCLSVTITVLIISLIIFAKPLKHQIIDNLKIEAENAFLNIFNSSVEEVIKELEVDYNDLANITYLSDGKVSTVSCNTVILSKIKSLVSSKVIENINNYGYLTVTFPLGNVLASEYTVGFGPLIKYRFSMSASVKIEFISEFKAVGNNQSMHKIIIKANSLIDSVMPFDTEQMPIESSYTIAETVILGTVPNTNADIKLGE